MLHRRTESGGVNPFVLLALLALAGGCYWAWVFGPPLWDHLQLKQSVRHAGNVAYVDRRDEAVIEVILKRAKALRMKDTFIDRDGSVATRPSAFNERNIKVDIRRSPPEVTVEIHYDRHVVLPFLNRERLVSYTYEKTTDLSDVKW